MYDIVFKFCALSTPFVCQPPYGPPCALIQLHVRQK